MADSGSEDELSEQELRDLKHSKMFRNMIKTTVTSIVICTQGGVVKYFNESAEGLFGFAKHEVLNQNLKFLMPEPVRSQHDGYLKRYVKTRESSILGTGRELVALSKKGIEVPIHLTVIPLELEDKLYFVGFARSVADRQKRMQELSRSRELSTFVLSHYNQPFLSIDQVGTVKFFNSAAETLFGRKSTGVVGKNVKMLMPEYYAERHDSYLENYLRTGIKKVIDSVQEVLVLHENGKQIPCDIRIREAEEDGERLFYAVLTDVTERKARVQLLKSSENRIFGVLNNLTDGIVVIDAEGTIQMANVVVQEMLGYERGEIVDKNVSRLMPEPYRSEHDGYLRRYNLTKQKRVIGPAGRSLSAQHSDGSVVPVHLIVAETEVHGQKLFTASLIDQTDDMLAMERTQKSEAQAKSVVEAATDAFININEEGTIDAFNLAAEALFGYDAATVVGKNVRMLMPQPYCDHHDGYLQSYLSTGIRKVIGYTREVAGQRADGSVFPMDISVSEVTVGSAHIFTGVCRDITERKEMEMALKKSEERIKSIFENCVDGVVVIDKYGDIESVNQAAVDMFKFNIADELVGVNVRDLMPEPYHSEHDQYLANYNESGIRKVIGIGREAAAIRRNGEVFPVELSVSESQVGSETHFTGIVRDISARRDAEENLRVSQEKTKAIMESALDGIIVIDEAGTIEMFNKAAYLLFGYEVDESLMIGSNISRLMPEPYSSEHKQYLKNYLMTGVRKVIGIGRDVSGLRQDGSIFPVELSVSEVMAGSRRVFTGIARDLTEQREIEQEINKREAKLRSVIDQAVDAVVVIDSEGIVQQYNPAAVKVFGYHADDVIDKNVKMLMPSPYCDEHDTYLRNYIRTGVRKVIGVNQEVVAKRSDGEMLPVELVVSEAIVGSTRQFTALVRDITERKLLQDKMKKSEAQMKLIVENATDGLITISDDGIIMAYNSAAEEIFGYSAQETLNNKVNMLMTREHAMKHDHYLKHYIETGEAKVINQVRTVPGLTKRKAEIHVELSVTESSFGSQRQYTAVVRNVTARMAHKIRVEEKELHMSRLIESAVDGIVIIDSMGYIAEANHAARLIFEIEAISDDMRINSFMPEPYASEHDSYIERYLKYRDKSYMGKTKSVAGMRRSGGMFSMQIIIHEVVLGGESYFAGMCRDLGNKQHVVRGVVPGTDDEEPLNNTGPAASSPASQLQILSRPGIQNPQPGLVGGMPMMQARPKTRAGGRGIPRQKSKEPEPFKF